MLLDFLNIRAHSLESKLMLVVNYFSSNYIRMRKRCAEIHKTPRFLLIEFRTFRHLGGSMIAHYTNSNVLTVKRLLRHKRVENTKTYIQMIHFNDKECEVATATTSEEVKQLECLDGKNMTK
jgi:integrase